jgi:capsular exopolysaccharide synthesis family protein
MTPQRYRVVLEGRVLDGFQAGEVKRNLANLFKVSEDEIERFFWGRRLGVKKAVDYQTAVKYLEVFERTGVRCWVEGVVTRINQEPRYIIEKQAGLPSQQHLVICPRCRFEQVQTEECIRCGSVIRKFLKTLSRQQKPLEKTNMKPRDNYARIDRISVEPFIAEQESLMAEQFRKLRSVLNVHYLGNSLRSVLITSLAPEEGKTTVSLNLSATVAKGLDASVVLIDGDIRKKGLSMLLGLEGALGLTDVLEGRAKLEEAFVQSEIDDLTIVPAGAHSPSYAELIASTRMKNLVQVLRNGYESTYVIIDSAPFLPTSDAHALGEMVDGIIVVILAEQTRRDVVKRELHAIKKDKLLGVVLNNAEFETSGHYHKYYKHYYGGQKQ